ncbi:hypothetical protein [Fodinicola acaciae]|uniref:hypothetical protein n=1 Tax=Fodinicola acaciae TaxID=2681555 RepID=UPI0013D8C6E4|nr:hypothetical protein [Fodinicola acaciae]
MSSDETVVTLQSPRTLWRLIGWRFPEIWPTLVFVLLLVVGVPLVVSRGRFEFLVALAVVGAILFALTGPITRRLIHRWAALPVARFDQSGVAIRLRPATAKERARLAPEVGKPEYDVSLSWTDIERWRQTLDSKGRRMFVLYPADSTSFKGLLPAAQHEMALNQRVFGAPLVVRVDLVNRDLYQPILSMLDARVGRIGDPGRNE